MKTLGIFILLVITLNVNAQKEFVFLGLDFTKARFIGSEGFNDPAKIQSVFLDTWNDVMFTESEKFDLAKLYKKDFSSNFDFVKGLNKLVDVKSNIINEEYSLSEDDVKKYVSNKYKGSGAANGVVFIVESFNKTTEEANIYIVLVESSSGKINYIKKFQGQAEGFGFRNFWLGGVYNVMKVSSKEIKKLEW